MCIESIRRTWRGSCIAAFGGYRWCEKIPSLGTPRPKNCRERCGQWKRSARMSFLEILDRYADRRAENLSSDAEMEFEVVARHAPQEVVSEGLADAFRADQTPPFGDMVAHLFQRPDPEQRAALLNMFVSAVGATAFADGPLGDLVHYLRDGSPIAADEADA